MSPLLNGCVCRTRAKQLMKHMSVHPSIPEKAQPVLASFVLILLLLFLLEFIFCCLLSCLRKRSHRQQIEIADIHISAEPSLDLSPNILSVSICLQFFKHSFQPSLPRSRFAPIGSPSCRTGRLPAPSHRSLAAAVRICPRSSRSLAFCLWTDDTAEQRQGQGERGRG